MTFLIFKRILTAAGLVYLVEDLATVWPKTVGVVVHPVEQGRKVADQPYSAYEMIKKNYVELNNCQFL